MSQFYEIDSTRVSCREYWWWHASPLVLIVLVSKWTGRRIACSSDDANTETTLPFVVPALPPEVAESFVPLDAEFTRLGFLDPVYHVIYDTGTQTVFYWATYRHESGRHFARIHRRVWYQAAQPNRALFPLFFTAFADGTFLVSSSGKPDMASPATVPMNRRPGRAPAALWESHQQLVTGLESHKNIAPVRTAADLVAVTEQLHILLRDFHLARGVFRPRTEEEQARVTAYEATIAQAGQLEHAGVLAELQRLLEPRKASWSATLLVLVVSIILFVVLGVLRWNWSYTLWLIPVLLLHESGHWLAMRLFHYRNLRMFFIPLFGAAVTGRNWNVAGWKKAVVFLAGPLPGIALGTVLGIAGLLVHTAWLSHFALILLLINGFNLLPVLPLDGGHVLHLTLFCRNRWLDIVFRVLTVLGLILLASLSRVFFYLGILTAVGLPYAFRMAKVRDSLQSAQLAPPEPGDDQIPVATAQAIITALKASSSKPVTNKMLAQQTLSVFETINAHPPGFLASLGLLVLQGGAFLVAGLFCLLLIVGKQGSLGSLFSSLANQPHHLCLADGIQTREPVSPPAGPQDTLVATFASHALAGIAFTNLSPELSAPDQFTLFGDSLLLTMPSADNAARKLWFDRIQNLTTNLFVVRSNTPVLVRLNFIAPTTATASNLVADIGGYFQAMDSVPLIAPWSPAATGPEAAAWRQARHDWQYILTAVGRATSNRQLTAYTTQIEKALQRGDTEEAARLGTERTRARRQLEAGILDKLRADTLHPVNPALLDYQAELAAVNETNLTGHAAVVKKFASLFGPVPPANDLSGTPIDADGASGAIWQNGLIVQLSYLTFNRAGTGLSVFTTWLYGQHCKAVRYDFIDTTGNDDAD